MSSVLANYKKLYENPEFGSRPRRTHKLALSYLQQLRDKHVMSIVDLGCGRGFLVREFSYHGFTIDGADACYVMLGDDRLRFHVYNVTVNEFDLIPTQGYDFVLMVDFLDHLDSLELVRASLEHAVRIARKGIGIAVNGDKVLHTIQKDIVWWEECILKSVQGTIEHKSSGDRGTFFMVWLEKDYEDPSSDEL